MCVEYCLYISVLVAKQLLLFSVEIGNVPRKRCHAAHSHKTLVYSVPHAHAHALHSKVCLTRSRVWVSTFSGTLWAELLCTHARHSPLNPKHTLGTSEWGLKQVRAQLAWLLCKAGFETPVCHLAGQSIELHYSNPWILDPNLRFTSNLMAVFSTSKSY